MELNKEFEQALELMENTERHVFVTGKAGVGKSTLLKHFKQITVKNPVVLAPTGVAALNVQGQTIHSFFGFFTDITVDKIKKFQIRVTAERRAILKKLQMIVIDEISMVRADLLDCINEMLKIYGPRPGSSFGGVQMVFIGDLCQLPPVVTYSERKIFNTIYKSPFFFDAHCFEHVALHTVELQKIYRQTDEKFITLLNKVRSNTISDIDLLQLNTWNTEVCDGASYILLTTTKQKAADLNAKRLSELQAPLHKSNADINGKYSKEYYPNDEVLEFKVGAQVMMLNNDLEKRWVNGTLACVQEIKDGSVTLLLENGMEVTVTQHVWRLFRYGIKNKEIISNMIGEFKQYPFKLAWALTIHKSQGKTFNHVQIDMDRGAFASGQLYVALSRCTSPDGILIEGNIERKHVFVDPAVVNFFRERVA